MPRKFCDCPERINAASLMIQSPTETKSARKTSGKSFSGSTNGRRGGSGAAQRLDRRRLHSAGAVARQPSSPPGLPETAACGCAPAANANTGACRERARSRTRPCKQQRCRPPSRPFLRKVAALLGPQLRATTSLTGDYPPVPENRKPSPRQPARLPRCSTMRCVTVWITSIRGHHITRPAIGSGLSKIFIGAPRPSDSFLFPIEAEILAGGKVSSPTQAA
jgi:hypothetical protein